MLALVQEQEKCGQAGDIGSLSGRPSLRNILGGDKANSAAWPWHAVISLIDGGHSVRAVRCSTCFYTQRSALILNLLILVLNNYNTIVI